MKYRSLNQYKKHRVERMRAEDNRVYFAPHWAQSLTQQDIEELNRKDKPNALDGMAEDTDRQS